MGTDKKEPNVRIAVIEDDPGLRQMLAFLLGDEGFAVIAWPFGAHAHTMILHECPEVVLLDVRLEEKRTGLAVLDEIRADPRTHDTHVIICSGDVHFLREQIGMLRERRCAIIEKPFDIGELLALIRGFSQSSLAADHVTCS